MQKVQVINVGQGDCSLFRIPREDGFKNDAYFVDMGSGNVDISNRLIFGDRIHVFLSHGHRDHIGGIKYLFGKTFQLDELVLPLYQNEMTLIAKAILNLKGIRQAKDCEEIVSELEDIVNNQIYLKEAGEYHYNRVSFAYEGRRFASNRIRCLNPSIDAWGYDWISEMDTEDMISTMNNLFSKPFAEVMGNYIWNSHEFRDREGEPELYEREVFSDFWLPREEGFPKKCNVVFDFIFNNINLLKTFNSESTRENLKKISEEYGKTTHDVCMVLKAIVNNQKILFAGDVSKKSFHRIINNHKVYANYLKMPHHGSIENIDETILDAVKPEVAIISHGNRRFGKADDSHPNREVLELLSRKKIRILITNDVIKPEGTIMKKENHTKDPFIEIVG